MTEPVATFLDGRVTLHAGDCLAVLDTLPEASVDAVVTDPPYHYDTIVQRFGKDGAAEAQHGTDGVFKRASAGFMGKTWDGGDVAFSPDTWAKVMRVLKPGGMLAAFSAPKCYHKMAFAIELAGFEMRDRVVHLYDLSEREVAFLESLSAAQMDALAAIVAAGDPLGDLLWTFGTGFPKGLDVAKAIDKHLGVERTVVGRETLSNDIRGGALLDIAHDGDRPAHERDATVATSDAAKRWDGWNVALKLAYEPIALARKPLAAKSVAAQVLATGTGAMNIGGTRIGTRTASTGVVVSDNDSMAGSNYGREETGEITVGRWPANLTHDGSDMVVASFPGAPGQMAPVRSDSGGGRKTADVYGAFAANADHDPRGDAGSAARFFYSSKADADDRLGSGHPTVKPVDLMRWLVRLLTPPGGIVLDPFAGTGTTGEAAWREGFAAILIEREAEYRTDIARRLELAMAGPASRRVAAAKAKAGRRNESADPGPLFGSPGLSGGGRSIYGRFADQDARSARRGSSDE